MKKKNYNSLYYKIITKIQSRILDIYDYYLDRKICGKSLVKYVPSLYRETKGATGSQSTHYNILDEIFEGYNFKEKDSLLDVGCGKGRVIAYLLNKKFPGKLYGVELNKDVAEYANSWITNYPNVKIINCDAFNLDFNQFTHIYMFRPFHKEVCIKFINKLENELTKPIHLFFLSDQEIGSFLNNRPGWKMFKRKWITKKNGLYIAQWPQRYSIWSYCPDIGSE